LDKCDAILTRDRGIDKKYFPNLQVYKPIGLEAAKENLERLLNLPIEIISAYSELIVSAAEIKAQFAISYADCFTVATAELFSGSIITGDPEFKKVEHLVAVDWI